ncbi:MAG: hypothetical protein ACRCYU_01330 [Nocardioides sp.]
MRLDLVLSGQVVVTDAQLLDGQLFAAVHPERLLEAIDFQPWNHKALRIRQRCDRLEEALLGLLTDPDGRVKDFEFSLLRKETRRQVSAHLRDLSLARRTAPGSLEELTRLLRDARVPDEELSTVTRHWRRWIRAIDEADGLSNSGVVGEIFAASKLDMNRAVKLHEEDLPRWEDKLGEVSSAADRAVEDLRDGLLRAESRTRLYEMIATKVPDKYGRIIAKDYVDRVYGFAFAMQHDCEDYASNWRLPLQPVSAHRGGRTTTAATNTALSDVGLCEIEMPSDFMARLGLVDHTELSIWTRQHAESLRIWRNEEDTGTSLKRALGDLETVLAENVSPSRIELQLLAKPPAAKTWGRMARLKDVIQRYVGMPTGVEAIDAIAQQASAGPLAQIVSLTARPLREASRQLFGNAAILTTDIATQRRSHHADHS